MKKRKVLIMYRENDLYKDLVPQIREVLRELSCNVNIFSFPSTTKASWGSNKTAAIWKEQLKKWLKKNYELLSNSELITDETCNGDFLTRGIFRFDEFYKKNPGKLPTLFEKRGCLLDELVDETTARIFLGKNYIEKQKGGYDYHSHHADGLDLEQSQKILVLIMKRILQKKKNHPKKIFISPPQLNLHLPFSKGLSNKERYKNGRPIGMDKEAAETIQGWMQEIVKENGIKTNIQIAHDIAQSSVMDDKWEEWLRKVSLEGNWIIGDRHQLQQKSDKVKIFKMPIPSLLHGAIQDRLIPFSQEEKEEMKRVIKNILKKIILHKK